MDPLTSPKQMTQYMEAPSPALLRWAPWLASCSLQQAEVSWQEGGTLPGIFHRSRPMAEHPLARPGGGTWPLPAWLQQLLGWEKGILYPDLHPSPCHVLLNSNWINKEGRRRRHLSS